MQTDGLLFDSSLSDHSSFSLQLFLPRSQLLEAMVHPLVSLAWL